MWWSSSAERRHHRPPVGFGLLSEHLRESPFMSRVAVKRLPPTEHPLRRAPWLPRDVSMVTTSVRLSVISAGIAFLALGCQILTARTFGARHEFDIYLVAISVPFLVVGPAPIGLASCFVPRLVAAQRDPGLYR